MLNQDKSGNPTDRAKKYIQVKRRLAESYLHIRKAIRSGRAFPMYFVPNSDFKKWHEKFHVAAAARPGGRFNESVYPRNLSDVALLSQT
jgi:hypothetical protein